MIMCLRCILFITIASNNMIIILFRKIDVWKNVTKRRNSTDSSYSTIAIKFLCFFIKRKDKFL